MRRTMFVVPTPLVPIVQRSSSEAIAARLRRALVKELAAVVDDPDDWLTDVSDATVARLQQCGGATASGPVPRRPEIADQADVRRGQGLWWPRLDQHPGAEHPLGTGPHRSRAARRGVDRQPVRVGVDRDLATRRFFRDRCRAGANRAGAAVAGPVRSGHHGRHHLVDRMESGRHPACDGRGADHGRRPRRDRGAGAGRRCRPRRGSRAVDRLVAGAGSHADGLVRPRLVHLAGPAHGAVRPHREHRAERVV